jgi:hypothetical protein
VAGGYAHSAVGVTSVVSGRCCVVWPCSVCVGGWCRAVLCREQQAQHWFGAWASCLCKLTMTGAGSHFHHRYASHLMCCFRFEQSM